MGIMRRGAVAVAVTTLSVGLLATAASADELTETATVELEYFQGSGGGSLAAFDPSLGTLTSVAVTVDSTFENWTCVDNRDQQNERTPSSTASAALGVSIAGLTLDAPVDRDHGSTTLAVGDDAAECLGGPDARTEVVSPDVWFISDSGSGSDSMTSTDAGVLATFTGPGTVPFTHEASSDSNVVGTGNFNVTFEAAGDYVVTVVYTYDSEPNPTPTPTPTPTATPTEPEPTPSVTPTPTPTPTPSEPPLPETGAELGGLALAGLGAAATGAALLIAARRRRLQG